MYSLDIVFDSYKLYNEIKSYRKSASILKTKYNCSITRQIIMIWIKNINKNFLFELISKTEIGFLSVISFSFFIII